MQWLVSEVVLPVSFPGCRVEIQLFADQSNGQQTERQEQISLLLPLSQTTCTGLALSSKWACAKGAGSGPRTAPEASCEDSWPLSGEANGACGNVQLHTRCWELAVQSVWSGVLVESRLDLEAEEGSVVRAERREVGLGRKPEGVLRCRG